MEAFVQLFGALGYASVSDDSFEKGKKKIVLYADSDGVPTHAARQLGHDQWTSKLGKLVDVRHQLQALNGVRYGTPRLVLATKQGVSPLDHQKIKFVGIK